ncbi:energy transducer TonB [Qipengyuania sp. MTN3-11]|uniref:energy transducer TonB n=1 Tax=Qipengyuania sp. MTN3-11 TaxID=3056557 RepID=UPI0036F40691
MSSSFAVAAILTAQSISAQVPGATPVAIHQAQAAWVIDYADDRCRIIRTFSRDGRKSVFYLESTSPNDGFRWLIAGDAVRQFNEGEPFEIQFGPGFESMQGISAAGLSLGDYGMAVRGTGFRFDAERTARIFAKLDEEDRERSIKANLETGEWLESDAVAVRAALARIDPADPEPQDSPETSDVISGAQIEWIELNSPEGGRHRLETGNFGPVMQAMKTCIDDLVTSWGLDVTQVRNQTKSPEWLNQDRIVSRIVENYPSRAVLRGQQAEFKIRVIVEPDGDVESCTLTALVGPEGDGFKSPACGEIRLWAKFAPAQGADGRPIKSFYQSTVRYVIPD